MVAILGLMAGVAASRWGGGTLAAVSSQGLARSLELNLALARRQAICEGVAAAVVLTRVDGAVASVQLFRASSGGDVATDGVVPVPDDVTVTAPVDRWVFDYTGVLTSPSAGGTIQITDGTATWTLTVNAATGHIQSVKTY